MGSLTASGSSAPPSHFIGGVAGTTITLEGANQWTQSGSSFGRPWDQVVAEFKKVTGVTVNTDVLPLATFSGVESAQLAAGIAPDLVFSQANYQPYMVVPLNKYLSEPNPFVAANKSWLSEFDPSAFSAKVSGVLDPKGNFDWVPFNLVGVAMYYNKDAFKRAGVTAPVSTFAQLISDCGALAKAGYTPMAMDSSAIGIDFPYRSVLDQMVQKQFDELDHFTVTGAPGKAEELTTKDVVWGIATGKFAAGDPYVKESVVLLKQLFDSCATKDWSGITGLSGDGVGLPQFEAGKAAMAFAVDFGYGTMAAERALPDREHALPRDNHGDHEAVGQRARTLGQHRRGDELHDRGAYEREGAKGVTSLPAVHERPAVHQEMAGRDRGHRRGPGHHPASVHGRLLRGRLGQTGDHRPVRLLRLRHRPGSAVQRGLRRLPTRLENARPGSALLGGPLPPGCRVPGP